MNRANSFQGEQISGRTGFRANRFQGEQVSGVNRFHE